MTTETTKRTLVIPLDARVARRDDFYLSAILAKLLDASVRGVFVLNARSLDAASLPFAVEISRFSATERALQRADLDRFHRKTAGDVERLLTEVSYVHQINVSFNTLTGERVDSALTETEADVLLLPRPEPGLSLGRRTHHGPQLDELVVFCDNSPRSSQALQLAQRLHQNHRVKQLTLLYETTPPLELLGQLQHSGIHTARLLPVDCRDPRWLQKLRLGDNSLLLLPRARLGALSRAQQARLLDSSRCRILLLG